MPYKDGTGPTGQGTNAGSGAGRGAGRCAGQGGAGRPGGRGFGGRRRGLGGGAPGLVPGADAGQNQSWIGDQITSLQAAIQGLTARFNALNKE